MARKVQIINSKKLTLTDNVEELYEKRVTSYGNGAKIDSQKKHIGKRAYVIIVKN